MLTEYARNLIARAERPLPVFWDGFVNGAEVRLRLIDRNEFNRCLVEWPDGGVRSMHWSELKRRFKGLQLA